MGEGEISEREGERGVEEWGVGEMGEREGRGEWGRGR